MPWGDITLVKLGVALGVSMSLQQGMRIGPYQIIDRLGAGGMGEVYRAVDTRLGRSVALKILPEAFAQDADRLARFEREARLLASLSHPNIATLFGLEEADGRWLLAMELAEGEDLSVLIARGPIPPGEAFAIARQIADGLAEAHDKGIVHRDLKPANVKISSNGTVKVLDFGLARAYGEEAKEAGLGEAGAPTLTAVETQPGLILGTVAYMSPEQARGQTVDKRTDIWAFGVVLYEMLSGRSAFGSATTSDTLAAVLTRELDWSVLPASTPPRIRRLLAHCLERNPKRRLRDIGDALLELGDAGSEEDGTSRPVAPEAIARRSWFGLLGWALALCGLAAAVGQFLRRSRTRPACFTRWRFRAALAQGCPGTLLHQLRWGAPGCGHSGGWESRRLRTDASIPGRQLFRGFHL